MASSRLKKKDNKYVEEKSKDRLSDLPDAVLLHILSYLPDTKYAVQTSVLSKRWKCLWASLPVLLFCGCGETFNKLVRRVLSGRNNLPVTKFCFHTCGADKSVFSRIVNYSVSHHVQHFSIRLGFALLSILFPFFNHCRSLKTLELENFRELQLFRNISLPTLNTLHLYSCSFCFKESMDPFIGLVNLKSLQLNSCNIGIYRLTNFKISGPKLHTFTMNKCHWYKFIVDPVVEIFAPQLYSFTIIGDDSVAFSNLDFPLLEIADIDVSLPYRMEEWEKNHLNLINLFQGLYNAQSLYLSSNTIKVLMEYPDQLEAHASPFVRLKTLNVRSYSNSFSITDQVINYLASGSISRKDIRINIQEKKWL